MDISVVGTGNIGGILARRLARYGHPVTIANSRGPASLMRLAHEIGAVAAQPADAIARAHILIVSVPMGALPILGRTVEKNLPVDAVILDTSNYVPELRDARIAAIDEGLVESLWAARQLGRPVIKALNTIGAASLASAGRPPHGNPTRIAAPVSGDDPTAKQTVITLLDQIGFDGFDAADLDHSWRQEPGTPIYTTDLPLDRARKAIDAAVRGDTAAWRERIAAMHR